MLTQHPLSSLQLLGFAVSAAIKSPSPILAVSHRETGGEDCPQPQPSEPNVPDILQPSPQVALTASAAQSGDVTCLRSPRETGLTSGFFDSKSSTLSGSQKPSQWIYRAFPRLGASRMLVNGGGGRVESS